MGKRHIRKAVSVRDFCKRYTIGLEIHKNMNATHRWCLDGTRYVPIQRHINVPVLGCNLSPHFRSASSRRDIGADDGCRITIIREDHAHVLVNLTGDVEGASVRNTGGAWLGTCPNTALPTGGLRPADSLATDGTGCGAPKPLLLRGQLLCVIS
jgi:hypothetical protein